jgi:hypothetical protein
MSDEESLFVLEFFGCWKEYRVKILILIDGDVVCQIFHTQSFEDL